MSGFGSERRRRMSLATAVTLALMLLWVAGLVAAQTPEPEEQSGSQLTPDPGPDISHSLIGRANCLVCHKEGFRGASAVPSDHADYVNADCEVCHKAPEDLQVETELAPGELPTPIAHPPDEEGVNSCYECHVDLDEEHEMISLAWQDSVHGPERVGCADCHGGDPTTDEMNLSMSPEAGFIGVPSREAVSQVCGACHSDVQRMRQYNLPTDQYIKYMESVHGVKLAEGDTRVALCVDCHGVHDIKKASDPEAAVYPLNVPDLCSSCHSDPYLMEPYNIPTDQYDTYSESVHGELLLVDQDVRAPTCTSCHGSHAARPPTDEEVVNVCGKCHTATQGYYEESRHSRLGVVGPKCWTCHGTHDVSQPNEGMFVHAKPFEARCGICHVDDESFRLDKTQFENEEDRRCDTCHHEDSRIMTQVRALQTALTEADHAYSQAEEAIIQAADRGMIVAEAEAKLAEARTSLITARATSHTTKLPPVTDLTDASKEASDLAQGMAEQKLRENEFRRQAMVVATAFIVLNIVILYLFRRYQVRQYERTHGGGH